MDGVLEGAAVLCVCKIACSLLFLPSLASSHSAVSFCCCCLLIFTDFLVAGFLSFLYIFESWLSGSTLLGNFIALRFLLFLSHTYGAVLLLTTPLIAVETMTRLLWPHSVVSHKDVSPTLDSDVQHCYFGEVSVEDEEEKEEEEDSNKDKDNGLSHVVGYLCCLTVWVAVALNVRWRWRLEEEWTVPCLYTTNSLIRCLPNLFSPMPSIVNPCWGMTFLSFLLLLLTLTSGLHKQHLAFAHKEGTHRTQHRVNNNGDSCWQDLIPAQSTPTKPVNPAMSVSEPTQCVDPEKTGSSCTVHRAYSWNSVQMSMHHHGDFVLVSPGCVSAERGGQEKERTKRGIPLTFITEVHMDLRYRSQLGWRQWGFPCLGVNVMIRFVGVLSIFVLPLNLSVNILLIRTIETLLELCVTCLLSFTANTSVTSASNIGTFV